MGRVPKNPNTSRLVVVTALSLIALSVAFIGAGPIKELKVN